MHGTVIVSCLFFFFRLFVAINKIIIILHFETTILGLDDPHAVLISIVMLALPTPALVDRTGGVKNKCSTSLILWGIN